MTRRGKRGNRGRSRDDGGGGGGRIPEGGGSGIYWRRGCRRGCCGGVETCRGALATGVEWGGGEGWLGLRVSRWCKLLGIGCSRCGR